MLDHECVCEREREGEGERDSVCVCVCLKVIELLLVKPDLGSASPDK